MTNVIEYYHNITFHALSRDNLLFTLFFFFSLSFYSVVSISFTCMYVYMICVCVSEASLRCQSLSILMERESLTVTAKDARPADL